jgi:hypothetical protein
MMFGGVVRALAPILLITKQALGPIEPDAWYLATSLSIWARGLVASGKMETPIQREQAEAEKIRRDPERGEWT